MPASYAVQPCGQTASTQHADKSTEHNRPNLLTRLAGYSWRQGYPRPMVLRLTARNEKESLTVNLADVLETVATHIEADAPAIVCDGEVVTWQTFDNRANALARRLLDAGLGEQSKVGLYLRNGPDYLIAFAACLKARLCSFNINYRYGESEVDYLLDNADCEALIFDAEFATVVGKTQHADGLALKLVVRGDVAGTTTLTEVYAGDDRPLELTRDSDDLFLIYTGGTTGMPKAVMWTCGALWEAQLPGMALPGRPPPTTLKTLAEQIRSGQGRYCFYIAPPLMHGTGLISALGILFMGGSVALTGRTSFDAAQLAGELQQLGCDGFVIVGDAFARPLLDVLDSNAHQHNLTHVRAVVSSGMMWSPEVKKGLLKHMPDAQLIDGLGASESTGFASSITTRGVEPAEARFNLTGAVVLHPETLTPIQPGSGEIGVLAKSGALPLGYYKDPERTAQTYVTIHGVRHVIGGDHALVEQDGSIRLLGRGNNCINTAGEKVYPEEVEETLKAHPDVQDALIFGVDNARFGQTVEGVVSLRNPVDADTLINYVRTRLAAYKTPRRIHILPTVPRGPSGKADYPTARSLFEAAMQTAEA